MVDFQQRDTRRSHRENGEGEGDDGSDGEAEIDQVRQQLEERPREGDEGTDGGSDPDHAAAPEPESAGEPDDDHDGHDDEADHDHHHHDLETLGAAVVTVSSSRTLADDPSGDHIVQAMVDAGHDVVTRELIPDDYDDVQHTVDTLVGRGDVDVVVSTGGTGVTPDDCTVEAARPLFDKELPGFGELFRRYSEDQIGTRIVGTRATAGVVDGVPVFCLPGSRDAVELGVEEIIVEEAPHLAGLAQRDHDHGTGHDHGADHAHGSGGDADEADEARADEADGATATDGDAGSAGTGRSDGGQAHESGDASADETGDPLAAGGGADDAADDTGDDFDPL